MTLRSRWTAEGGRAGRHASPLQGASVEFRDHRDYAKGDNLRHLDWKVYARSERHYIKRFHEETSLRVHMVLDVSASMRFAHGGRRDKFSWARQFAAAVAYLAFRQQDACGVVAYDDEVRAWLPARSGVRHQRQLLDVLAGLEPRGRTATGKALEALAEGVPRRGVIIMASDLLDDPEAVFRALAHFRRRGHDVVLVQVMDPAELDFPFDGVSDFIDMETDERLEADAALVRREYREAVAEAVDGIPVAVRRIAGRAPGGGDGRPAVGFPAGIVGGARADRSVSDGIPFGMDVARFGGGGAAGVAAPAAAQAAVGGGVQFVALPAAGGGADAAAGAGGGFAVAGVAGAVVDVVRHGDGAAGDAGARGLAGSRADRRVGGGAGRDGQHAGAGADGTRFEAAKRLAREWIESLEARDEVALWVAGDRLEKPVPLPVSDHAMVMEALDKAEAGDGTASLAPAFAAAREWASQPGRGRKELIVLTDNGAAAWNWPAERYFRDEWDRGALSLVVLQPDLAAISNLALQEVTWDTGEARPERNVGGVARLANLAEAGADDLLEVRLGDTVVFRKAVTLPPGGTVDVPVRFGAPAGGGQMMAGEVALAGDGYAADDRWWFALPLRQPVPVLLLDAEPAYPGALRGSHFLARALAAGRGATVEVVAPGEWPERTLNGVAAVFATGRGLADEASWTKLREFAEAGGTVVLFGDGDDRGGWGGWPVAAGDEYPFPAGRIATKLLEPDHALFAGVWGEKLPFPPLSQRTARRCAAAGGAKVLATMAGELPLLVEQRAGKGRVYWLNASADRSWGDLPLSAAWVPLVQQLARAGEGVPGGGATRWVGDAWPGVGVDGVVWAGGEGRITRAGLHAGQVPGGARSWKCAANVPRAESELRPADSAVLGRILPGRTGSGAEGMRAWRDEMGREVPLWPWLLGGAALVFVAEGWWGARSGSKRSARMAVEVPRPVAGTKRKRSGIA